MPKTTQNNLIVFCLISVVLLVVIALLLNRWYACVPLVTLLGWQISRFLPGRTHRTP